MSRKSSRKSKSTTKQVQSEATKMCDSSELHTEVAELRTEITTLKTLVFDLQASLETSQKELADTKNSLRLAQDSLTAIQAKNIDLDNKSTQLENLNKGLKDHLLKQECQSRRDNLLFDGIPEAEGETWDDCRNKIIHFMASEMNIENTENIKIVRCHRLGPKKPNSDRPRTVIAKFHWFGDREKVWNSRQKLKGKKFWVAEDFPVEIQNRRRKLIPVMKEARKQNMRSTVSVDKLVVNGSTYTIDSLDKLPENLKLSKIYTPSRDNVTAFFTGNSPLSNFYEVTVKDGQGNTFHSTEQYYQYAKAMDFKDEATAHRIKLAETPYQCFTLGQSVKGFNKARWNSKAKDVMYKACLAKFQQHPVLRDFLLATGTTTLVEASPTNKTWGIGVKLSSPDVFNQAKWNGENWQGKLLMRIRDEDMK